jgi:predicted RNase H-like nuclease
VTWVAGADGCKAGWVVVLREPRSRTIEVRVAPRIQDALSWKPSPRVLGIDIPIGLLDRAAPGGRECDREARALLGWPRASSVFSPPIRRTLDARTFEDCVSISIQTFGILPQIREVDRLPSHKRIVEVHPELSFYEMNGGVPIREPKKSAAGHRRRVRLIEKAWRVKLAPFLDSRPRGVGRDDLIDAMAVCWTAERVLKGQEIRMPKRPSRDSRGLRMEIVR